MLPYDYRLKHHSAFIATYNNHKIFSNSLICIYVGKIKTDLSKKTRIGFVVSKNIHKRAVVRNKIKRYMRECFRLALKNNQLLNIHKYISLVCVAKSDAVDVPFSIFNSSIHSLILNKL